MNKGYRIEEIYGAFLRLKIVAMGLEIGEDNPQVVFESINATGVIKRAGSHPQLPDDGRKF